MSLNISNNFMDTFFYSYVNNMILNLWILKNVKLWKTALSSSSFTSLKTKTTTTITWLCLWMKTSRALKAFLMSHLKLFCWERNAQNRFMTLLSHELILNFINFCMVTHTNTAFFKTQKQTNTNSTTYCRPTNVKLAIFPKITWSVEKMIIWADS